MPWRLGILAALLAWLMLASPAGAAIQRYTDSRGVIHISNAAPSRPAPAPAAGLAGSPGPKSQQQASLPETKAAPVATLEESAGEIRSGTSTKNLAYLPPTPEPAPAAASPGPAAPEKSPEAAEAGSGSGPDTAPTPEPDGLKAATVNTAAKTPAENLAETLEKVAREEVKPEAAPTPAAAAILKAAALSNTGGIQRYRDAQGVWHISDVTAENEAAAPVWLEASKGPAAQMATIENPPRRPAAAKAALPVQKVAWSQDYPDLATLPTSKTKVRKAAAPEALNLIRRYCDSKGVIHISNVEPEAAEPLPAPKRRIPASIEAAAPLTVKPVAWSGAAGEKPLKLVQARSVQPPEITTEGGIKRWRDKKGVWHIETVEYPLPAGVVLPPRQAGPHPAPPAATALAPATSPGAPSGASPAPSWSPAAPRVPTVTAFRDRQGRLKIVNDAPVRLGKPPAGAAPAPAELEPLIAEAAQVHRLPPTLVRAVIKTESNFCSWAVSPKGAMGLMQLMPGTAADLGVQEPFNPRENVHGGCRYLRLLVDFFGGNVPLALAAYNAGYQRVIDCGYQVPPIKETQEFVTQVMERYVAEEHRTGQPWT